MTQEAPSKISPELIWRFLDDNAVVVSPTGGKVRVLNGVGTDIWQMLAKNSSFAAMVEFLVAKYEVTPEQARIDLQQFLQDLAERGLLV